MFTTRKSIILLLLLAFIAGCGGGGSGGNVAGDPAEPTLWVPRDLESGTWAVMGSSTAAGAGATFGNGWVELLQLDFPDHATGLANVAKGGAVTYQGLSALTPPVPGRPSPDPAANIDEALFHNPVLLLVSYPSNDTGVGYAEDETVNNILAIRSFALSHFVPVIVVSSQPRSDFTPDQLFKLTRIDERLASAVGPCFVEVRSVLEDESGKPAAEYSHDGVHPNNAGHGVIAERVRAVIESGECVVLVGE